MLNYITEQPLTEPLVEEFLQAELKAGASSNSVKRYRGGCWHSSGTPS